MSLLINLFNIFFLFSNNAGSTCGILVPRETNVHFVMCTMGRQRIIMSANIIRWVAVPMESIASMSPFVSDSLTERPICIVPEVC